MLEVGHTVLMSDDNLIPCPACVDGEDHNGNICTHCAGDAVVKVPGPTHTWPCGDCGATVERYRGDGDVTCPNCSAPYNSCGQRLRDDYRGNQSMYDEDMDDLEGFERQQLRQEDAYWEEDY